MKKLLAGILVLGSLVAVGTTVRAGLTADLTITVTPAGIKSVALSQASLDLGALTLNTVDNVSSSVTVTNDGNIVETLGLRVKTADLNWTSTDTAHVGADLYNLRALFNTAPAPAPAAFAANDDLATQLAPVLATGVGGVFSGDQDGSAVNALATRGLWFKMDMPTSSTVAGVRTFVVEVSAN
jgi:hypothetical protein